MLFIDIFVLFLWSVFLYIIYMICVCETIHHRFMICLSIHHLHDLCMWDYTSRVYDLSFYTSFLWFVYERLYITRWIVYSRPILAEIRDISSLLFLVQRCFISIVNFVDDMSLISANMGKSRLFIKWLRLIIKSIKIALQYAHKIGILVSSTGNLFLICAP